MAKVYWATNYELMHLSYTDQLSMAILKNTQHTSLRIKKNDSSQEKKMISGILDAY